MPVSWIVLISAAALAAGAALWVLRGYRRANDGASPAPALIACAAAGLGALALYLFIGRPDLPDAPYAQRMEALRHRNPLSFSLEEALAVLHDVAKARPNDAEPHILTGQLLLERGQGEPAAQAFNAALRRDPRSQEAILGLAQAMVQANDGRVSAEALRMFQSLTQSAQTPDHSQDHSQTPLNQSALNQDLGQRSPLPYLYEAKAALEAGQDARPFWVEALARMESASPLRPEHADEDWRTGLGRALVRLDGRISPEALRLFQLAGAQSHDAAPWIYQAMAAMQAGGDARPYWTQALARMDRTDPRREMAQRMSTMSPEALQQESPR
jgi:cytochrome c-type biogenesis protein CcmH/NrfG